MGRILVVDDNDAVRIVLRTILEPVGRLVEDVSSVTQALDVIDASNPSEAPLDLIITDFQMPGRSGLELVECIRLSTRRNIQSLPVLMLSSNTSDAFRADSIIAGVNILMYKPFRSDRLLIAVEMLLTGR